MVEPEYDTFDRAFRRVYGVYRLKLSDDDVDALSRTYFRLLAHAALDDVLAAGKACLTTCKTFPKPVDWLHALPPTASPVPLSADLRVLGTAERDDYARAEGLRYRGHAVRLWRVFSGRRERSPVAVRARRGRRVLDRAIDAVRNRVVVTGHWAHGPELGRWYDARAAFYASAPRSRTPIARALLVLVGPEREPGCDDE